MKKTTLALLFSAISLLSFAQSAFTEKVFNDLMERYQKDFVQFIKTETAPDFMLVGTSGNVFNRQDAITLGEGGVKTEGAFSDVKTRQYGTTGIATGRWKHNHLLKNGAWTGMYDELFTYIFSYQKGKWIMVSAQHSEAPVDRVADEKQIQAGADAFIKSWNNHDFSDMKNYLTEDCDWANPVGMLWKNRKEVMYAHDAYHKTFLKNTTMTKEKTTIRFTTADAAVVHIVVHLTEYTRPDNQKIPEGNALDIMVFTKKGDKWLISSAQITNIDAAAQEMNPVKMMPKE